MNQSAHCMASCMHLLYINSASIEQHVDAVIMIQGHLTAISYNDLPNSPMHACTLSLINYC